MESIDSVREMIRIAKAEGVRGDSMRDQAWAEMSHHLEFLIEQAENYELHSVVRMAVCMVVAELFKREGDSRISDVESQLPPQGDE